MTLHPTSGSQNRSVMLHLTSTQLTPAFPHPLLKHLTPLGYTHSPHRSSDSSLQPYHTTLDILVEPLILGVIPQSTLPTVYYILIAAILSGAAVPLIVRLIEAFASTVMAQDESERLVSTERTKAKVE